MSQATLVYRHPAFTGHNTGAHPENPGRIRAIDAELARRGLLADRPSPAWAPATREQIARVHDAALLDALEELTRDGGGWLDADTEVLADSLGAARLAAGAGVAAVEAIREGAATTAFVLGRPPGHHATSTRAMGFCLLNTIAISAAHGRALGYGRVAIVDWDVHHGNGTQDIFYERDDVLVCSTHRYGWPFFPGTGSAEERGRGAGEGFTLNVPLRPGDGDEEVAAALTERIGPAVERFAPELILLSAGYDAHVEDPLGGLRVTDAGFQALAARTKALADRVCEGRLIAVLEGGYAPRALARGVADTLAVLDGASHVSR